MDPAAYDNPEFEVVTAWRTDRLKRLTYTQLWFLIQEHKIEQVGLAAQVTANGQMLFVSSLRQKGKIHD